jgi:ribosomal protein S18 acetylase RimI-like enzyme
MPGRTIRRATPADAAVVAGIHVRGWQWGYRGILPEAFLSTLSVDEREAMWRKQLDPSHRPRTWLAEEDDRALGFVGCGPARDTDLPARTGEVYAIYREELVSGAGVGRMLMSHALDDLRADSFESAVLWVLEKNVRSRRFYEIGGWCEDGAVKTTDAPEGARREVRYARGLG